jgi:hypothetical protein
MTLQLHICRVLNLVPDLISHCLADGAFDLELGRSAVLDGDAQADCEFAVVIRGVLRLAPVGGEQFADVVEGGVLDHLVVFHGRSWLGMIQRSSY